MIIPIKSHRYNINYYTGNPKDVDLFYKGVGIFTGDVTTDENDNEILYLFEMPDNLLCGYFSEEDIESEVTNDNSDKR